MKRLLMVILIVVNVVLSAAIVLTFRELTQGSSQIIKWRKKEQEINGLLGRIKQFDENKILAEHKKFIRRIPADSLVPLSAMKALRQVAEDLTIQEIRFSFDERLIYTLPGIDNLRVLPFNVALRGTYESLIRFLEKVPSSEILMVVSKVKIQRSPQVPLVDAFLTMQTFTTIGGK